MRLSELTLMAAAERVGIQVPRVCCIGSRSKSDDLAREAVSWNAVLGRSLLLRSIEAISAPFIGMAICSCKIVL